LSNWDCSSGG